MGNGGPRAAAVVATLLLAQSCGKTLSVRIPDPCDRQGIHITITKIRADWPIGFSVRGVAQNRTGRELAEVYMTFELRDASDESVSVAFAGESRRLEPDEQWRFKAVSLAPLEEDSVRVNIVKVYVRFPED